MNMCQSSEPETFDPSLVPVSSIVTLAKVAQKLVDGNGTLTNPGNLTVTGNMAVNGNLKVNGIIESTTTGPFFTHIKSGNTPIETAKNTFTIWNNGSGEIVILGSTGTEYAWTKQVGFNGANSTISCNNITPGYSGAGTINTNGTINITGKLNITTPDLGIAYNRGDLITIMHPNKTQGIGIAYDGIYKTGTAADTNEKNMTFRSGGPPGNQGSLTVNAKWLSLQHGGYLNTLLQPTDGGALNVLSGNGNLSTVNCSGISCNGATSTPAGSGDMKTWFPNSDGNNYIRGNTYISGTLNIGGTLTGNKTNILYQENKWSNQMNGVILPGPGLYNATALNIGSGDGNNRSITTTFYFSHAKYKADFVGNGYTIAGLERNLVIGYNTKSAIKLNMQNDYAWVTLWNDGNDIYTFTVTRLTYD